MPLLTLAHDFTKYFDNSEFAHKATIYANSLTAVCCGVLLASQSSIFEEKLFAGESDILLERFCYDGCEDGIKECLASLHGANLEISVRNIDVILKFSAYYNIEQLFGLGLKWIRETMSPRNIYRLDKVISFIDAGSYKNLLQETLDLYIINNTTDVCNEILHSLQQEEHVSHNLVNMVLSKGTPKGGAILAKWTFLSVENMKFILEKHPNFNLKKIFEDTTDFINFIRVFTSKNDVLGIDSMKQIIELQNSYYVSYPSVPVSASTSTSELKGPSVSPKTDATSENQERTRKSSPTRSERSTKTKRSDRSKSSRKAQSKIVKKTEESQKEAKKTMPTKHVNSSSKGNDSRTSKNTTDESTSKNVPEDKSSAKNADNKKPETKSATATALKEEYSVSDELFHKLEKSLSFPFQSSKASKTFTDIFFRSQLWQNLDVSDILTVSSCIPIDMYTYMELVILWTEQNKPEQKFFSLLWNTFKIFTVNYQFLLDVKRHFEGVLSMKTRPIPAEASFNESTSQFRTILLTYELDTSNIIKLFNKELLFINSKTCPVDRCAERMFLALIQLSDTIPSVLGQTDVDLSAVNFPNAHLHPDNVFHWYAMNGNRYIPLNLVSWEGFTCDMAFLKAHKAITLKCVVGTSFDTSYRFKVTSEYSDEEKARVLLSPISRRKMPIGELLVLNNFSPYHFIELCLSWIEENKPTKRLFNLIWSAMPFMEVSETYIEDVKEKIESQGYPKKPTPYFSANRKNISFNLEECPQFSVDMLDEHGTPRSCTVVKADEGCILSVSFHDAAPYLRLTSNKTVIQGNGEVSVKHLYAKGVSAKKKGVYLSTVATPLDTFRQVLKTRKTKQIVVEYE